MCIEKIPLAKGWCVNTISGTEFNVSDTEKWPLNDAWKGQTWFDIRNKMVLVPAEASWVPIKTFIIKMCKQNNQCQEEVRSWDRTIQKVDDNVGKK